MLGVVPALWQLNVHDYVRLLPTKSSIDALVFCVLLWKQLSGQSGARFIIFLHLNINLKHGEVTCGDAEQEKKHKCYLLQLAHPQC